MDSKAAARPESAQGRSRGALCFRSAVEPA